MAGQDEAKVWRLDWNCGTADVLSTGAILHYCTFRLPDGRIFSPLASAPWAGDPAYRDLPGHMRWLGGEFVCLPFGVGGAFETVDPAWRKLLNGSSNAPPHGLCANEPWRLIAHDQQQLAMAFDYPPDSCVKRVVRSIGVMRDASALDMSFGIEVRRECRLPVGIHPIIDLGLPVERLKLNAAFDVGLTYPAIIPPNAMLTAPGRAFDRLTDVPAVGGGRVDLSRLPKPEPAEDVVQLCGVRGPVTLDFLDAGARLTVDWDTTLLPSCLIWIGDRALQNRPWLGRFRGLGIEPIAAAFDFAEDVSLARNPIAKRGFSTALHVSPEEPKTIRYRLEASLIDDRPPR